MRLRVRCMHCGRVLRLDPAFAGARCRCRHCGGVTDVPIDHSPTAGLPRPAPPRAQRPHVRPAEADPHASRTLLRRLGQNWWVAVLLALVGVTALYVVRQGQGNATSDTASPIVMPPKYPGPLDLQGVATVPPDEILARLEPSFLGKPITAGRLAWLIDGGSLMSPYYADVTTLVATSMSLLAPAQQKVALFLAAEKHSDTLPPTTASHAAVQTARDAMRRFHLSGRPDLAAAFGQVAAWKPDVVFLLLSQQTDRKAMNVMIPRARADHITVYVVAVGGPYHGWRSLAELTHGEYMWLSERDLQMWVDRVVAPPLPEFRGRRRRAPPTPGGLSRS